MSKRFNLTLAAIVLGGIALVCLLSRSAVTAQSRAAVSVSFLDDAAALEHTLVFLVEHGVPETSVEAFRRAVAHYYEEEFKLDVSRFPEKLNGFYEFESATNFVSALPDRLCNTAHSQYEINCFTSIMILLGDRMKLGIDLDDTSIPLLTKQSTNGVVKPLSVDSRREAFGYVFPDWYTNRIDRITGMPMPDSQKAIAASLHAYHDVPGCEEERDVSRVLMTYLQAAWKRQGLQFPVDAGVVLLHSFEYDKRFVTTEHAGVLFQRDDGFTYIDKAGGGGPFVRMDLKHLSQLATYYASLVSRVDSRAPYDYLTVNDRVIMPVKHIPTASVTPQ